MIFRLIPGSLAGADDFETDRLGPVELLHDEGRLIAVGHGVDDTVLLSFLGENRAEQTIGLNVDHDHMFARLDGGDRMGGSRFRITGNLQDHLAFGLDQGAGVVGYANFAGRRRVVDLCGRSCQRRTLFSPTSCFQGLIGPLGRELGNAHYLHSRGEPGLVEKHGAELARSYNPDSDRCVVLFSFFQHRVEIQIGTSCVSLLVVVNFNEFLHYDRRILDKIRAHRLEQVLLVSDLFSFRSHDVAAQQLSAVESSVALFEAAGKFGHGLIYLSAASRGRAFLVGKTKAEHHVGSSHGPADSSHLHARWKA